MGRPSLLVAIALASAVVAGCGSMQTFSRPSTFPSTPATSTQSSPGTTTAPAQAASGVSPADVAVTPVWAIALRTGDVTRAAGYFAIPSEFENGPDASGRTPVLRITTARAALLFNESLPCGATFHSAKLRGRYIDALFSIGSRTGPGGSNCGGATDESARVLFVIKDGKIVDWFRAPSEQGDPGTTVTGTGTGTTTLPAPPPVTTPGGGIPVV